MANVKEKSGIDTVLGILPKAMRGEILRFASSRLGGVREIREVRVRLSGRCSLIYKNEYIPLLSEISREDMENMVYKLCDGALYAHKESISSGFISIRGGVRVGVCGFARYEYKNIVHVSDMSSLVFRIPIGKCDFEEELFAAWDEGVASGMLIYSAPGIGKTTALRALARHIGSGRSARRVVVVDERCEFPDGDFAACEVDILKGYRKRQGLDIAARTMSPEVVMIDEVGADDAPALLGVLRFGVPIIATAHAATLNELYSKPAITPLIESGAFDVFLGISRSGDRYSVSVERR